MTHEVDKWDAEEWLQHNKDIWNHPMVTDRTETNGYEVADLMAEFANYILSKQKQKPKDMKYRKKPVEIEAIQFTTNFVEIEKFCQGNFDWSDGKSDIKTLEGIMKVSIGDYVIKGVKGEFYACKPDIFEMTYEKVD